MATEIQRAAVLGAGVMGSGIAAHLANAGIPVLLLDIVPPELSEEDEKKGLSKDDPRFRNKFSAAGLQGIWDRQPMYQPPMPAFAGLLPVTKATCSPFR